MSPISLPIVAAGAGGSAVASWGSSYVLLTLFVTAVSALLLFGEPGRSGSALGRVAQRIPNALERLTGIPGWAAATSALGMFGLLVAGIGFYSDVAYHIAFGRDEELLTAPHVGILMGLLLILLAAVVAVLFASLARVPTKLRWRSLRVPWSALPLGVIGVGAVIGFPIDDVWHRLYGVDVTMWSPPHLMMILGAAITGLASWLVLAEAGVSPRDGAWARGFHVVAAWLTLLGLTAPAGEFYFGVPQWQQLFHPVLVMLAAGVAVVAMRIVLGAGWTLGIVTVAFLLDLGGALMIAGSPIETRPPGLFIGSAVAVELVALLLGTSPRLRFALASGLGIGTLGMATEWWWNTGAHLPWTAALFPDAVLVGLLAAVSAAVLGAAFGSAVARQPITLPPLAVALAGVGMLAAILIPIPRSVGDVEAAITIEHPDPDHALVHVTVDPPDAADDARWFTVGSWQGGDRIGGHMVEVAPGEYVADRPVNITGGYKSLLRLHRGAEMMAVPIRLPEDPEIDEDEIPAEDRTAAFVHEQQYLQREVAAHDAAGPWFARFTFALSGLLAIAWIVALTIASMGIARSAGTTTTRSSR